MQKHREWGRWVAYAPAFNEGGQGRLYYVIDATGKLEGEFVLKELKNPKREYRFESELKAIDTLGNHPNLIHLVDKDIFRNEKKPCYVMEKADGNLETHLAHCDNVITKLQIFRKICEGVSFIHSKKIIHRDIKPANILMYSDEPVVADLGLCLISGEFRNTMNSEAVGPRYYMAPELEDGKCLDVNCSADVYSLGKVLYYILSDGKIFAREKHKAPEYYLPIITNDKRFAIFDCLFDKSICEVSKRFSDVNIFLENFSDAYNNFYAHPITNIFSKFDTFDNAFMASEKEINSLTQDEIITLFDEAYDRHIIVPDNLLKAACVLLKEKITIKFVNEIITREKDLPKSLIIEASQHILLNTDVWLSFGLRAEDFDILVPNALLSPNQQILKAITDSNVFCSFRCSDYVNSCIVKCYEMMDEKSKQNFLMYTIKSSYDAKEKFLLNLSCNNNLDDISLEAIVAGLSALGTSSATKRIQEIGNSQRENIPGIVLRGILRGGGGNAINNFDQLDWANNPQIESFLQITKKISDDQEAEENKLFEMNDYFKDDTISNYFCNTYDNFNEIKRNATKLLRDIDDVSYIVKSMIDEKDPEKLVDLTAELAGYISGNYIQIADKIGNQEEFCESLKSFKNRKEYIIKNQYWDFYQALYLKIKAEAVPYLHEFYYNHPPEQKHASLKLTILLNLKAKTILKTVFVDIDQAEICLGGKDVESKKIEVNYHQDTIEVIIEIMVNRFGFDAIDLESKAKEAVQLYTSAFEEKFMELIGFNDEI